MKTVLVVDDMAIFRDPIGACLRAAGYRPVYACNGAEAISVVQGENPALILLDLAMPVMDGLSFLRVLRTKPATAALPVILLTAASDKESVLTAAKLGVRDYMLKSRFSLRELLERVGRYLGPAPAAAAAPARAAASEKGVRSLLPERPERYVAQKASDPFSAPFSAPQKASDPFSAAGAPPPAVVAIPAPAATPAPAIAPAPEPQAHGNVPQLLTRAECIHRAEKALEAKTLSGVVMQVVAMAASPRGDLAELATLISRDPILSARVLQAANSAAYASARAAVSTIPDAVRNIGCSTVRNIAAAMGVFDTMPSTGADGFNPIRCWQHSFGVAMLCEQFVAVSDPEAAGGAYVAGLCHDLGDILFHTHFGREHQQIVEQQQRTGRPRAELERQMLGITHGELVLSILRCLGLPASIQRPIEQFHRAAEGRESDSRDPVARAMRLAEIYANGILLASSGNAAVGPIGRSDCRSVTGRETPTPPDAAAIRSQILALTGMLARLAPGDEAELMAPLFAITKARIYLARDPGLSSLDPVAAALEALAQVQVQNALPPSKAPDTWDGLVVLARSADTAGFDEPSIARAMGEVPAERVLWLVQSPGKNPTGQPFRPVQCPVSLSRLAEFSGRAAKARASRRALAA